MRWLPQIVACFFILPFQGCADHGPLVPVPPPPNQAPVIRSLQANPATVATSRNSVISVDAEDPDGQELVYRWHATSGTISGAGASVTWTAPSEVGAQSVEVEVSDSLGAQAMSAVSLTVISPPPDNADPVIESLRAVPDSLLTETVAMLEVRASDPDGDPLNFFWTKSGGTLTGGGERVQWTAPGQPGVFTVTVSVTDGRGGSATQTVQMIVYSDNLPPQIQQVAADPSRIKVGESTTLSVEVSDPDGDPLAYHWSSLGGSFTGTGASVTWTAPSGPPCCAPGNYVLKVKVDDGHGGLAEGSVIVQVEL